MNQPGRALKRGAEHALTNGRRVRVVIASCPGQWFEVASIEDLESESILKFTKAGGGWLFTRSDDLAAVEIDEKTA